MLTDCFLLYYAAYGLYFWFLFKTCSSLLILTAAFVLYYVEGRSAL